MQAFINLHGISSIGEWNKLSTKYGGNSYDITSNARFNLPAAIVDTFNKNNWQTSRLDGFLVGNDPIKYKSWYVFDPSDSNKEVDISNSKYISINSDGYVKSFFGDPIFTFMPNMVRWGFKNGVQNDTIMVDPTLWRNSPNATTLSLTAPKDTTINYEKSVDLSKENLGEVKVKTNLKLGKELDFYARNEYVGGHVVGMGYIEKTSSIVDTVYLSNDKKDFRVKKKTLVKLIEDNTVYNSTYPNGRHWKHTIKKDSVYQTITVDHITSVGDAGNDVPKKFEVSQNFPNPFNPSTTIRYELPKETHVIINIYNLLGQKVKTLVNSEEKAGTYNTVWNGRDNYGNEAASGIYIYRVAVGSHIISKKMILMK